MFALPCFDIGTERWTTSGFLHSALQRGPASSAGNPRGDSGRRSVRRDYRGGKGRRDLQPQRPMRHDNDDTPAGSRAGLEICTWATNDARGGSQPADWRLRNPSHLDQACPWERVLCCYFSAPGVLCHFEKAHPSAHGASAKRGRHAPVAPSPQFHPGC